MKKNNENKNGKEKFELSLMSLLTNNRVLMVLSIVIAFVLWMWVAVEKSPEVQKVITNVPVQIDLTNSIPEQLNLQIFGETQYNVDVTVTGKKYVLSNLDKDDIIVEANTNYVDSPGTKTLQLRISPKNESGDFDISSVSATYIEVFFDTYKEIEMPLTSDIVSSLDSIVEKDCLMGDIVLSKGTVMVSGPATEINRITSVKAVANVDSVLTKTTTFDPRIELVTGDGIPLDYSTVNFGENDITMTVPVLKVVTLPTSIEFKNVPPYFLSNPLPYSISPASVNVAIPIEAIETTKSFVVDTIDFADITNSYNTFNVEASSINSYKIMDTTIKRFKIKIDASDFSSKTITVPGSSIQLKNSRTDFKIDFDTDKNITINLIGPIAELNNITAENIIVELDTADKVISSDTKFLPGKVMIKGVDNCWAVGRVDIKITAVPIE